MWSPRNPPAAEDSLDARGWAKAFVEQFDGETVLPSGPLDEGTMIAWFANAMEAGQRGAKTEAAQEVARALLVMRGDHDDLPEQGEWPCQYNPAVDPPPRLVPFLYRLLRDGATAPADVEGHALQVRGHEGEVDYTNPHIQAYAESLAGFLLARLSGAEPVPERPDPVEERRE